jgi:chromosome segregation ATPase
MEWGVILGFGGLTISGITAIRSWMKDRRLAQLARQTEEREKGSTAYEQLQTFVGTLKVRLEEVEVDNEKMRTSMRDLRAQNDKYELERSTWQRRIWELEQEVIQLRAES